MSGDLGAVTVRGRGALGIQWVETWDVAKYPTACRTAPSKDLRDLTVHCTKVGNLGLKGGKKNPTIVLLDSKASTGLNKQISW